MCFSWFLEFIIVWGLVLFIGGLIVNIEEKIEERGILFLLFVKNFY